MLRLLGCVLTLSGAVLLRQTLLRAARRRTGTLRELREAMLRLEQEIALDLSPVPKLLRRGGYGTATDAFFAAVRKGLCAGATLAQSWADAALILELPPVLQSRFAALGAALGGTEQETRRSLLLMAGLFAREIAAREAREAERERLTTALCLGGGALLCIVTL